MLIFNIFILSSFYLIKARPIPTYNEDTPNAAERKCILNKLSETDTTQNS
jgi:hypothetical protein